METFRYTMQIRTYSVMFFKTALTVLILTQNTNISLLDIAGSYVYGQMYVTHSYNMTDVLNKALQLLISSAHYVATYMLNDYTGEAKIAWKYAQHTVYKLYTASFLIHVYMQLLHVSYSAGMVKLLFM